MPCGRGRRPGCLVVLLLVPLVFPHCAHAARSTDPSSHWVSAVRMPPDSVTTMSSVSKDMPKPNEPCVPELDSRLDAPESPPEIASEQDVDVKDGATVTVSASGTGGGGSASLPSRKRKRENYIDWDSYFMGVAFLSAMRSKDPSTQVGACIVDQDNRIVGIGYNGFPRGCSDDELPWARESELTGERGGLDTKYPYVCHAEVNAILNMNIATAKGCRMYVALFPCNECAKVIIQSGVREVVYMSDKYHDHPSMIASRRMFDLAGVCYRQYVPNVSQIVINFSDI